MSHTFNSMFREATELPWTMGARLMVELRSTVKIPEEPKMTKSAAAGLVKIARIIKKAQNPEKAQQAIQQQAMTDPNVTQALDYQQAENERQTLMAKIQELQMATEAAQAQAQMSDQQAQAATQQQEQLVMQAQQAKQEQVNAVMESMQAKDQTLKTQVSAQQHRQQVAQFAQQMADQLKQIASTSPEEQQMQEAQAEAEQQQAAMQQQAAPQQGEQPVKKKTKQQQQEAQNAQENAQKQQSQAEQSTAQDQQELQGMQAQQPQVQQPQQPQAPTMGGQPKMGSAKLQKIAAMFKFARLRKQAQFSGTNEGYGESQGGSGQQGMYQYSSMGKCGGCGKMAKLSGMGKCGKCGGSHAKVSQFTGMNTGFGESQGGSGEQGGMNQYASMGELQSRGKRKTAAVAGPEIVINTLKDAYSVGKKIRGAKLLWKNVDPKALTYAAEKAGKLRFGRAALHLGEHAPKYQAAGGAVGAVGAAGTAGAVGYHQGKKKTASEEARAVGSKLGVDWSKADFTPADLAKGMKAEEEHGSKDPHETAKVAIDHLHERGDYYDLLAKKVEDAPKMDGGESASKEKQEHQEKQGSFDSNRAAAIANRVRLIKKGQLKKACRDSMNILEFRQLQLVKSAADISSIAPVAEKVESGALRLGRAGAYTALGAAIGAAYEKSRLSAHAKKVGLDKPTQKEFDLTGKLVGAKELARREPTYGNKLRVHNIKYKIEMERLGREHPNRAAIRGAGYGALGGFALGPFAHRLVGKLIKR